MIEYNWAYLKWQTNFKISSIELRNKWMECHVNYWGFNSLKKEEETYSN